LISYENEYHIFYNLKSPFVKVFIKLALIVIPAKAGIHKLLFINGFPIKSGMTKGLLSGFNQPYTHM